MVEESEAPVEEPKAYPEGDYAVVEVMGHLKHIGRYAEVEKFGQKFCQVEPILNEQFQLPILVGAASIYQFRYVTPEYAWENAPQSYEYRRRNDPPALPRPGYDGVPYGDDDEIAF